MRTPMMARLKRAFAIAAAAEQRGMPPADELVEIARGPKLGLTRRRVLQSAAAAASLALVPRLLHAQQASAPEVVVVGGGVGGLNAAFRLHSAGVPVRVFEAARRVGGRMYSRAGVIAPDLVTELGGELVNTDHRDMLALIRVFDIPLIDLHTAESGPAIEEVHFAQGKRRAEAELVAALRPVMRRLVADRARIERDPQAKRRIDRMSLAEYLAGTEMAPWLRAFLTIAFTSEMGSDAAAQSALYFASVLQAQPVLDLFQSDEHYSLAGGNQRVTDALAARLEGRIELEHRLESVRMAGSGYELTFSGPNHAARSVRADAVILAMPFTLLRQVELRVLDFPPLKRRAIRELGYGTNAKVFAALKERVWQGAMVTDLAFNQAWDNARNRPGSAAGLSIFGGGQDGVAMGTGSSADQVARFAPLLARAAPALADKFSGPTARFHWPSYPLTLGSYSCYRPGQWTAFEEVIAQPVGGLFFAGEHCSPNFQGYMNGGAESGRIAADALLQRVTGTRAAAR
jgi:monoamine oxidase